jgi:clan AA aspartic protease (TIGR02281 family)
MRRAPRSSHRALLVAAGLLLCWPWLPRAGQAGSTETVAGRVYSSDHVGLEGVVVTLEGIGSVASDSAGGFRFEHVPPGHYRVTASKEGFPEARRLIAVHAGRLNRVSIVLAGPAPRVASHLSTGVPLVRHGSALAVRARLNDRLETLLLLDTGATVCVLTGATANSLGLVAGPSSTVVRLQTAAGAIEAPLVQIERLQIGEADARGVEAVVHDIPGLSSAVGGLLGLSFLDRFKMEIDQDDGVLLLTR